MQNYLIRNESCERDNTIVNATNELHVEIANLRREMHQRTWKIIGLLGGWIILLEFMPNIFN